MCRHKTNIRTSVYSLCVTDLMTDWQLAGKMAACARAPNVNTAINHPPYLFRIVK